MKRVSLSQISAEILSRKQEEVLLGGHICGCICSALCSCHCVNMDDSEFSSASPRNDSLVHETETSVINNNNSQIEPETPTGLNPGL